MRSVVREKPSKSVFPHFCCMPEMKSMLIVEGDYSIACLFAEIFSQRNWNVDTPRNGRSIVEALLGKMPYDIILTSYRISVINGIELVRLIRELECRKQTPILMVTRNSNVMSEAIVAGVDEFLCKPIEPDKLVAAVTRHVLES